MDYNNRLTLSYYKTISTINDEHKIYLVQHIESNKIFVKKIINVYNKNVYEKIMEQPLLGIPKIFELIEDEDSLIIIEEYVSGETLQDMIDGGHTFSDEEVRQYVGKLCGIVAQLHSFTPAIIHRDIKPSNVILTPDHRIVLLDLNAAKYYSDNEQEDTMLLGTKGYAAPEQFGFGSSSTQTDIYAIGMLMVAMLTGQPVYQDSLDTQLDSIITRCIKINPKERYTSVKELQSALVEPVAPDNHSISSPNSSAASHPFILPGFRSKNPIHMAIAVIGYSIIVLCSLSMTPTEHLPTFFESLVLKICFFSMGMLLVFGTCNYQNIWRYFPPCKVKNKSLKVLAIICLDFILVCLPFIVSIFVLLLYDLLIKA